MRIASILLLSIVTLSTAYALLSAGCNTESSESRGPDDSPDPRIVDGPPPGATINETIAPVRKTVSADDVRQVLDLRDSFDPAIGKRARVFHKGAKLSKEARALLAPFQDRSANGRTRYTISPTENRYPAYYWVTVLVDSETGVIEGYEYVWEEEDRSDWEEEKWRE